jgi:uncharacterized OsmC-like protein
MTKDELRALQAPLKNQYQRDPGAALVSFRATGRTAEGIVCAVETRRGIVAAGLHPAAGGDGTLACSADMLLEALAACAGVTLEAVATAWGVALRDARVVAEGDLDFRGTLGMSKDVPVGFREIRLRFELDADAPPEKLDKIVEVAERYCVVFQSLHQPTTIHAARTSLDSGRARPTPAGP